MGNQHAMDLFEEEQKFIKAQVLHTIFHNEENLYSVVSMKIIETNETYDEKRVMINGHFPRMHEDEVFTLTGHFKDHPKYGKQYLVETFKKELPQTKTGMVQYLASDLFKGIGKRTAEKIVDYLGEHAISKIMDDPAALEGVVNKQKAQEIYDTIIEHQGLEKVMSFLNGYGFGTKLSIKIYQQYKEMTLEVIRNNPYQLIEEVDGIGFGRADDIGRALGISGNHNDRVRAGCFYTLENVSLQDGHVFMEKGQLVRETMSLLNKQESAVAEEDVVQCVEMMQGEGKVIIEDERIYLASLFYSEKGVVKSIRRLMNQEETPSFPEAEVLLTLGKIEEQLKVQYAPFQQEAIQTALHKPMMLLTGGPGTGKTTVIKGIVEMYASLHGLSLNPKDYSDDNPFPILLTAPTGRAAKRMSESTGLPACTIHRLLGWTPEGSFQRNETDPVQGKLLIIDEFSMVDIWLANQLFKSLPTNIQVIIVGDEDQLPSVGPGQVLKDLLDAGAIPTVKLTEIYRQAEGSSVIQLAHAIKNGTLPPDLAQNKKDRSFIGCSGTQIVEVVKQVCENAKAKGFSARDVQVLAPMYRGPAGINVLNEALQEVFNPKKEKSREIAYGDVVYRVGDKVLQLVNQPESQVFNGDIGEIVSVFYAKENVEKQDMIVISFDGIEVTYIKPDLNQITHAYCCSIHKSQGSEFPIVIMPIVKSYYRMLRRNLIYTAITRSKKFLIICGEESAFQSGVNRLDDSMRQTTLADRLQESKEEVQMVTIDGQEMDVENISPYDFM
ncbi:ATP-dependent RecD-like DNA helicase [Bacillus cereus]|uniref:SF1B family DNA helicase RecD2 n=1 Tax=unclassified Bacillus (in: firmicutes) TaxID=185979 RepID=UPI00047C1B72|nr:MULTISPECIES: ATP-dependent RecD-like DNA helicase [unclassified Bacillus (in: firmicutes)]PFE01177.1 ATP-dependent RecD-like DNA helicase [Bacillus sp. AFS023182]PGY04930.1 ATP-dependent RecD-like DNA helicase [Bacillus cereus]SDY53936.1 ATP-dependent DNA helicase, RecD/TraA family [Bacillus sp. 166amftsu]